MDKVFLSTNYIYDENDNNLRLVQSPEALITSYIPYKLSAFISGFYVLEKRYYRRFQTGRETILKFYNEVILKYIETNNEFENQTIREYIKDNCLNINILDSYIIDLYSYG